MRARFLLSFAIFSTLVEMFQQVNKFTAISTPTISFANSNFGYTIIKTRWKADFNHDVDTIYDLNIHIEFPFAVATPVTIGWVPIDQLCDKIRLLNTVTSTQLVGDSTGGHFFKMTGANFSKSGQYYMEIKLYDFPAAGFQGQLGMSIVSTTASLNYITYSYNNHLMNMYFYAPAGSALTVDTSPSSASPKYNIITKSFLALIDVTFTTTNAGSRLFFKVDKQTFRYDSAQTCEIISVGGAYTYYAAGTYTCTFEDEINFKGLYFTLNSGTFATGTKIRLQVKLLNPTLPSTSPMSVALMKKYEPKILDFVTVASAFTCISASFQSGYPKLFYGPSLDTSASTYPNLPLFSSPPATNAIVFNSIRVDFLLDTDLPEPADNYIVIVTVNGGTRTNLPLSYVYDNFNKAAAKTRKITTVAANSDITIVNVGEFSSLVTYSVGFKIVLQGDEALAWTGTTAFCSIQILDSSGSILVSRTAPVNVNANAKTMTVQGIKSASNYPTDIHTVTTGTLPASFGTEITGTSYGLKKSTDNMLIIKGTLGSGMSGVGLVSYLEVITNTAIVPKTVTSWTDSNAASNCITVNGANTETTATILQGCYYTWTNKGSTNKEYALLRMGAKTAAFWWTAGSDMYWGWRLVDVPVSHSMFVNDVDAAILDAYINLYQNTGSNDITSTLTPVTLRYLDNMKVINSAALTNLKVEYSNYYRHATQQFDDNVGSTFLRISGVLNNVDTFKAQKILLFFTNFNPMYLDSNNYEIGCSGSDLSPVRCFYKGGLVDGQRTCTPGICTNSQFREIIEVHFTTSTIAVSNAQQIQIIIPIKMKTGANSNLNIPVGISSVHTGSYSDYNQLIEYVETKALTFPASFASPTFTTLAVSTPNINLASTNKPYFFQVDTTIKGVLGTPFSSKFDIDCSTGAAPYYCSVANNQEYYSLTMCGNWDFMSNSAFSVSNPSETYDVPDIYRQCIQNIKYQYTLLGVPTTKYCLWCPMFEHAPAEKSLTFTNMVLPDYYNQNWPPNTYSMFSGTQVTYGIINYLDFSLQTAKSFQENRISSIYVTPTTWYKNYKSMKLALKFTINNKIRVGGTILMMANTIIPLTFIRATNTYCYVKSTKNPGVTYTCTATCTTGVSGKIAVTMANEVPAGEITVTLYGLSVSAVIAQTYATFYIVTTTPIGTAVANYLDKSDLEAIAIQFENYPTTSINTPDVVQVTTRDNDQAAISILNLTIGLSNGKNLYMNDRFKLTFDATPAISGYDTTAMPFWCYIVNTQGIILTAFKECYAETPTTMNTGLIVTTDYESGASLFNLVIEEFDLINGTPKYGAEVLTSNSPTTFVSTQSMAAMKEFTALSTYTAFNTFTVIKDLNYAGSRSDIKFNFKTQGTQVTYASRIVIQLHKAYDSSMIDNIHNCKLTAPSGAVSDIFCFVEKYGQIEITGFSVDINSGQAFTITFSGVKQPPIKSTSEFFYAQLFDSAGAIKETGVTSVLAPNTLASLGTGVKLLTAYDMSFTSSFIRSKNDLTFTFTAQTTIAANSMINIFLDYYSYEYVSLPTTDIDCTLTVAGSDIKAGKCTRVGKQVQIIPNAIITIGTPAKVTLKNLVSLNYASCEMKQISLMVVQGASLTDLLPASYVDIKTSTADLDPSLIYLNFKGLSELSFISIKRGLYNRLDVIRMDGLRFNDELNYTLIKNYNNQFDSLNPYQIEKRDSYFGEQTIPILIGSSKTTILSIFLIEVGKTESFKVGRFAPLPFLVLKTTNEKLRLPVPAELNIYRGYQSLPMILSLLDLPQADLLITMNIVTFDSGNLLKLKSDASITMNKDKIVSEILVQYTKAITSAPVSLTTSKLQLSVPADSPYQTTNVTLKVIDLVVDTSSKFEVTVTDTSAYGCTVDIKVHMPLTVYYYIVPRYLYADLTAAYINSQLQKGIKTDGYIVYGKMNIESSLAAYDLCQSTLMTNTSYVLKMYYETFQVQNTDPSAVASAGSARNITFDPLARVNFTKTISAVISEVTRLDKGSNYKIFSTLMNSASYGYMDLTFSTDLTEQNKKDLCCYFAQVLAYPLENIWTNDTIRCPSNTLVTNVTYFDGVNYTAVRRILTNMSDTHNSNRILQTATNQIRLYLIRNSRMSQNQNAWSGLSSLIFSSNFDSGLQSQYSSTPKIVTKSPLLSIDQIQAQITAFANFKLSDNGKAGNLTGIKLNSAGVVHSMILLKKAGMDTAMTYQHIRLGKNPLNATEEPVIIYKKYYASINEDFFVIMPDMIKDQTYVLYFFGTSQDPNLVPAFSPIYKYEFIIRSKAVVGSHAMTLSAIAAMTLAVVFAILN